MLVPATERRAGRWSENRVLIANFKTKPFSGSPERSREESTWAALSVDLRTTLVSFVVRLIVYGCPTKHLFVAFYLDEFPDQLGNSRVEALLLIEVIIKKISGVNSGEE